MAATLLSHGIAYGGTYSDPVPTETSVTLDTTGATFIMVSYAGDALQGDLDPLTDSAGNTWNRLTNLGTRPYFPGTSFTAACYWVGDPTIFTSATHTFTFHCIAGSGHACLEVMAWSGMAAPAFGTEDWTQAGGPTLTVGPATIAAGIAFAVAASGYDPTVTGGIDLTTSGYTTVDSLPATRFVDDFGHTGMTVGYKVYGSSTPGVTQSWTNNATGNFFAAGIFPITFTTPTPPVPPTPTTYPIRRLRRFMLPWDDANRWKYTSRLELVMQGGIGTADVPDPTVMLRFSKDGGLTWGSEVLMSAGPEGAYSTRVYLNRLPRARNPVVEISVSDPVSWAFVQALADMESGPS